MLVSAEYSLLFLIIADCRGKSKRFLKHFYVNTAQRLCDRCVVKFSVRWSKKQSEYLLYSRAFL
ncbi:hypothetical protein RUMCAL_02258 [Ruminococcus callidus ATCC 27760]|uniref:Uncharacterized protein n=1 Tax=Ruminococcus callidus ATCC 27760 TaxID=411473 RepID=U2M2D8_9FIRM|nr:hypothetical protein RUMCAL_02258 [Ruminococcus callidus ATCC 27760]